MSTTASRTVTIVYSGDVAGTEEIAAKDNTSSPGAVWPLSLMNGDNTIFVPTGGTSPTSVTIVPMGDNTTALTLKGLAGDAGVKIHPSDPTTIALDVSVTSIILNAAGTADVRLYWT